MRVLSPSFLCLPPSPLSPAVPNPSSSLPSTSLLFHLCTMKSVLCWRQLYAIQWRRQTFLSAAMYVSHGLCTRAAHPLTTVLSVSCSLPSHSHTCLFTVTCSFTLAVHSHLLAHSHTPIHFHTHSITHTLARSLSHLLVHCHTHPFTHTLPRSLIHLPIHSPTLFVHAFTYSPSIMANSAAFQLPTLMRQSLLSRCCYGVVTIDCPIIPTRKKVGAETSSCRCE